MMRHDAKVFFGRRCGGGRFRDITGARPGAVKAAHRRTRRRFGGAACARELRRADPRVDLTLVEANPVYTACPFSNLLSQVCGTSGRSASAMTRPAPTGIAIAQDQATAVDPKVRL